MNIVNVGYASTNYYVLGQTGGRLLIDVGWPGTLPRLGANLKRKGISLADIGYLLVTHYHPDHAGLAQEIKDHGVRLVVMNSQVSAIPLLGRYMKPGIPFHPVCLKGNVHLSAGESRDFLHTIGIRGEIIDTPGHSDDSVTLVLDEGLAFTGDLPLPWADPGEPGGQVELSWAKIRSYRVKTIYPGHGPALPLESLSKPR